MLIGSDINRSSCNPVYPPKVGQGQTFTRRIVSGVNGGRDRLEAIVSSTDEFRVLKKRSSSGDKNIITVVE